MPSGFGPWTVADHGRGGRLLVVAAVVAGAVGYGVVEVVTSAAFAIAVYVAVPVVAALVVAGTVRIVREHRRPSFGPVWRGESESQLVRALRWRPARRVRAVPVPALPVAGVPLAIEAPKRVLTGVVVERELARVTSLDSGTTTS